MIPMYDVQQSVEESVSFCLEARIRYDGVVSGDKRQGDVTSIWPLQVVSMASARVCSDAYPRVHDAWCLHQDHLL
jgi:hypothetical protein